jgi:N-acetylmuramoyl-L-alanine amidase
MRLILSVGHGDRDPGALNPQLHLREHVEAYRIVWELRDMLERAGHQVQFISCFQSLAAKIREVNRLHAEHAADLALEVHFNSAVDPTANGTEVLYCSPKNHELAARISRGISAVLGTRDRGAKKRIDLGWLKVTKPPALIVEVLFISNNTEAALCETPNFPMAVANAITDSLRSSNT